MPLNGIIAWLGLIILSLSTCVLVYVKLIRKDEKYIATWRDKLHYENNRVDLIIALKSCKTHDEMEYYYPQIARMQRVYTNVINERQLAKDMDNIRGLYIRFHFAITRMELKEKYELQLN